MLNLSAIFSVLYLYVEQFVHVGLPFVHRGIEKIKYSVILSTYHGKQILQAVTAIARSNANSLCRGLLYEPKVPTQLKK